MSEENWRPVVGYEGHYAVSDMGRVRREMGGKRTHAGRIRKAGINPQGYSYVGLCRNGRHHAFTVHRLVMAAFVGPRPPGMEINHKNGDKTDNRLGNLEYVTPSENQQHAYRIGLKRGQIGESNGRAILTESAVRQIKAAISRGEGQRALARQFGVSRSAIQHLVSGWRHVA